MTVEKWFDNGGIRDAQRDPPSRSWSIIRPNPVWTWAIISTLNRVFDNEFRRPDART